MNKRFIKAISLLACLGMLFYTYFRAGTRW